MTFGIKGGRGIEGEGVEDIAVREKRKNTTYSAAKDHGLKLSINDRAGQIISRHCSEGTRAY